MSGGVEVYKWIVLALSISSDFWLRCLVHEAWQMHGYDGIRAAHHLLGDVCGACLGAYM
jgi:hypothetical protein